MVDCFLFALKIKSKPQRVVDLFFLNFALSQRKFYQISNFAITSIKTIIRRKEVESRTGLSRSSIYLKISQKDFPAPIKLGARSVAWIQEEIDQWVLDRIAQSRPHLEGALKDEF